MAPKSVQQPQLPAGVGPLQTSSRQQGSTETSHSTALQLMAADSALQAARDAAAAASAAALAALAAPSAAQAAVLASPAPEQNERAVDQSPRQPMTLALAGGVQLGTPVVVSAATVEQQQGQQVGSAPRAARPARPSSALQFEAKLPEHDLSPGRLHALRLQRVGQQDFSPCTPARGLLLLACFACTLSPRHQVDASRWPLCRCAVDVVEDGAGGKVAVFPQRPEAPVCEFYMRTGHCRCGAGFWKLERLRTACRHFITERALHPFCRFGAGCRFNHPAQFAVRLNGLGLPLRPDQPVCQHFMKTGTCKFAAACKFHHPGTLSE